MSDRTPSRSGRPAAPLRAPAPRAASRRRLVLGASALAAINGGVVSPLAATTADAPWPQRPIRFIVPFPAGGPTDVVARAIAVRIADSVGQAVVVENVAGAGGAIGMATLARAAPDGHTIGLATTGTHAVNPHVYGPKVGYDPIRDFTPISLAVSYVNLLVVHPSVPADTVAGLLEWVRAHPERGTFGSSGNGATNHLSGELMRKLSGAPLTHVPYKGGAQALTDVMAGNTTMMFDLLVSSLPHVRSGRLKAIAVTSATRSPHAPDIPTMDESGLPGFAEAGSDLWFGIVGPARIPAALQARLNSEVRKALDSAELRERFRGQFLDPRPGASQDFGAAIQAHHATWGRIVAASGARVD